MSKIEYDGLDFFNNGFHPKTLYLSASTKNILRTYLGIRVVDTLLAAPLFLRLDMIDQIQFQENMYVVAYFAPFHMFYLHQFQHMRTSRSKVHKLYLFDLQRIN